MLILLKDLSRRADELEASKSSKTLVICAREFEVLRERPCLRVSDSKMSTIYGGMVDWNDQGLPTVR